MNRHQEMKVLQQEYDDLWKKGMNGTLTNGEYDRAIRVIEQKMDDLAGDTFEEFM